MSGARVVDGTGVANVATGVPVLDHLLTELARDARFDLTLEIEPDDPEAEVDAAGTALGGAIGPRLADGVHGEAIAPAEEAFSTVVLERSGRPLVARKLLGRDDISLTTKASAQARPLSESSSATP